eukprot:4340408-Alexandrium_andersonii.AAC.1
MVERVLWESREHIWATAPPPPRRSGGDPGALLRGKGGGVSCGTRAPAGGSGWGSPGWGPRRAG